MRKAVLEALDWPRFLGLAEVEARTQTGKVLVSRFQEPAYFANNLGTANSLQQETHEMMSLLDREALWGPLVGLTDPQEPLESLSRSGVLEISQLALLRSWLYALDSWTQTPREEIRGEKFKKVLGMLPDPLQPLRILEKVLTPEGELSERASPKLSGLYSEVRSLKREIGILLDHLIKTFSQKGVLQENFSDIRDGRYVIPVKISSQGEIDGIIYEASASRQTVFVEPKEVAQLNNRLRQRQNDLIQEIHAVLQATSKQLQPYAFEIQGAVAVISHWDAVQARARLGRHYSGKPIEVTADRKFKLHQCGHPLLWWSLRAEQIIRNDMDFGDPVRTLLLTGPNTGGKTVLLKTLGMAGLCARTGFLLPGTDSPTVPFFDSFFVDLGDAQSIEHHLSSFSGHIMRFKEILEQVTDRSLVLIDELNTATDPEEGAALGRAVLETVMARGALVVSTTHDPHLKALAVSDPRILNASMTFDEQSRSPTFHMNLGVPGRSRALETAERLGLPPEVLDLARSYLTREHNEFERLLGKLESDVRENAIARKEAVRIREEAERLKKEWTERTQLAVGEMLDRSRQKLKRILEQAQDEVRSSVRKLDEMRSRRDIDQTRGQLNEAFSTAVSQIDATLKEEAPDIAAALPASTAPQPTKAEIQLKEGTAVRIPKFKNTGTVLEVSGQKVKVAMGALQLTLAINEVEALPASAKSASSPRSKQRFGGLDRPAAPAPQLDLRGMRFDDAMAELDRYLDVAYRSDQYQEVTIVHGLGSGSLREGTRKHLATLPYIKDFHDGGAGHGGSGATVVEFDRG